MTKSADELLSAFRSESRSLWIQVLVVSGAILGFSASVIAGTEVGDLAKIFFQLGWLFLGMTMVYGVLLLSSHISQQFSQGMENYIRHVDQQAIKDSKNLSDEDKIKALYHLNNLQLGKKEQKKKAKEVLKSIESKKVILLSNYITDPPTIKKIVNAIKGRALQGKYFLVLFSLGVIFLTLGVINITSS